MQPADDNESIAAAIHLNTTGTCLFDLSVSGAHLKPITFGSHGYNDNEKKNHSFTGEEACDRWIITQNRKYLWYCYFYWLCDYFTIKEIL